MNSENPDQDQSKTALNALILEYLVNNNYSQSANIFKQESEAKEYNPSRRGAVLLTWFHMFNEVCRIRSGNYDEYDTLVRIESIMIKLEHDKSRCNKHPITRYFNSYRGREMAQNNMKFGTPPHPKQVVHMPSTYPKNMNDHIRKDHPHMMIRPRNGNHMDNLRNAPPRHPQMPPYRPMPHQEFSERDFYRNQNYPIHPAFTENQPYFEHTMKIPPDQHKHHTNYNRDPSLEQKDDIKSHNNPVKHPHMSDFMDQKKYTMIDMHQNKPKSPNEQAKHKDPNKNRDLSRMNETNRINERGRVSDTNKHNEFNNISERNKHNGMDNMNDMGYFNDLAHLNNFSDLNGLSKNNMDRHMSTGHKNRKMNNLKRIGLDQIPSCSCIFHDEQHSLLIAAFEDNTLKVLDLLKAQVIKTVQTGLSNIKQISIQKIHTSNDTGSLSEDTNENIDKNKFVWIICFNTKGTVTHYCKYLPDFSLISDQTIVSQSPVVSLISTNCYTFLLTETDLFFFNLQTEIVEKISKLSKNDVKDFLYINHSVFILKTRTKTVTWNVLTNYQKTIVNEPAILMASTTIQPQESPINPSQQFNGSTPPYHRAINQYPLHGNTMWYALLYKEFIQVLDHNLNFYNRIPLMHRLSALSIFDHHNIFTTVHKRIIWYHNSEEQSFDEHCSSIIYIFSYKNMNGRIGLVSISNNGEALISEL